MIKRVRNFLQNRKAGQKPSGAVRVGRNAQTGMFEVMQRVDKQVGRAVTRLADR